MHHRLKHIRKELKFTQKEMARELGVSLSTVQRFEKGNSSPDAIVLDRLSRLGVDLHQPDYRRELFWGGNRMPFEINEEGRVTQGSMSCWKIIKGLRPNILENFHRS